MRQANSKQYAISVLDNLTYHPTQQSPAKNVLNIFLDHLELPLDDVVSLDELNSDQIPVMVTVKCSMMTQLSVNSCHNVQ